MVLKFERFKTNDNRHLLKTAERLRGEFSDVYQYDTIPQPLRVQIIHILEDVCNYKIMEYMTLHDKYLCAHVQKILCREYGCFSLVSAPRTSVKNVKKFFLQTGDTEKAIDVIELSFQYIEDEELPPFIIPMGNEIVATFNRHKESAIAELNTRFREHSVGYQFESGQIIRVDSQYIHSKAARPVLRLLSDPIYKSANEEFLKAHEHYRKGEYKSCISECSNAFESVLKVICDNNEWKYHKNATSKPLLEIVYNNGLLPKYKKSFFDSVRGGLEHGIPVTRNQISGHGQGSKEVSVPDYMAEYMLNLTASSILLLVRANKN